MELFRDLVGEIDSVHINKSFAHRIDAAIRRDTNITRQALAQRNMLPDFKDVPIEELERLMEFKAKTEGLELGREHPKVKGLKIHLASYKHPGFFTRGMLPPLVPPLERYARKFAIPIYVLDIGDDKNRAALTSPYGLVPGFVIDRANKVCVVRNIYTFDDMGEGAKFEVITTITEGEDDPVEFFKNDLMFKDNQIHRVDAVMSDDDSRAIPLTPEDQKFVGDILTLYEAGEFSK